MAAVSGRGQQLGVAAVGQKTAQHRRVGVLVDEDDMPYGGIGLQQRQRLVVGASQAADIARAKPQGPGGGGPVGQGRMRRAAVVDDDHPADRHPQGLQQRRQVLPGVIGHDDRRRRCRDR
jgi:hypothetical protein